MRSVRWWWVPLVLVGCRSTDANDGAGSTVFPSTTVMSSTTVVPSTTVLPSTTVMPSTTLVSAGKPWFTFVSAAAVAGWSVQNDTVMGGASSGTVGWDGAAMLFAGTVSTDNNGGFSSVVSPLVAAPTLDTPEAVRLRVRGDGKTYVFQVRTSAADELRYIQRFDTTIGVDQTVSLPLAAFEPVDRFLEPFVGSAPLSLPSMNQLAIYILDGQVGPFELRVRDITVVQAEAPQ